MQPFAVPCAQASASWISKLPPVHGCTAEVLARQVCSPPCGSSIPSPFSTPAPARRSSRSSGAPAGGLPRLPMLAPGTTAPCCTAGKQKYELPVLQQARGQLFFPILFPFFPPIVTLTARPWHGVQGSTHLVFSVPGRLCQLHTPEVCMTWRTWRSPSLNQPGPPGLCGPTPSPA